MKLTRAMILAALASMLMPVRSEAGLDPVELAAAESQATNSLITFQGFITAQNFELLGFTSDVEILSAATAKPLLIYTVPLSRLINYQPTNDFSPLLYPDPQLNPAPVRRVIVPVVAGTAVRSSFSLRLVTPAPNARWTNANWGYPNLIRALVATAQSIPPSQLLQGKDPFIVEIPVFDVWLIGYWNNDTPSKLILVSPAEMRFGAALIQLHQVVTPEAMYQIRLAAERYHGLAN